jgi:hypothetical protein
MSLGASGARASTVDVFITITNDGSLPTLTFEVPENPTVTMGNFTLGSSFTLDNISVTAGGVAVGVDDFTFYNSTLGGGVSDGIYYDVDGGILDNESVQLYTGSENSPTFAPGTYNGTYSIANRDPSATVTIMEPTTTPLPSTWLMLLSGLVGLVYFAQRRSNDSSPTRAV